MEIQRKIYNRISDWKNETNGKKALLVEGARRIGKRYLSSVLIAWMSALAYRLSIPVSPNGVISER